MLDTHPLRPAPHGHRPPAAAVIVPAWSRRRHVDYCRTGAALCR